MDYTENNKLFSFEGVINRRNYIVNILLVETIIQALIATPLLILIFKSNNLTALLLGGSSMPFWFNIVLCLSSFISSVMYLPSIVRRIRDITGESQKEKVKNFSIITLIILLIGIPASVTSNVLPGLFRIIGLCILITLACIKGSVTGQLPKSNIAKFNWGAFIGTWIWGLFNKSYKTLWALPLTFTMGALPFFIVCGLKGNEWSYENNANREIEDFHAWQKKQTVIWAILAPVLTILLFVTLSINFYKSMTKYIENHPDFTQKAMEYYINTESKAALATFDKIELNENEYRFYINPKKWKNASYQEKIAFFDMADSYVILKNYKKENLVQAFSNTSLNKILNNIKIYSTFNNELLGEFTNSSEEVKRLVIQIKNDPQKKEEILKIIRNGYKFNTHPSLP